MKNPLVSDNCPDPCVTRLGDGSYVLACTTNHDEDPDKFPLRRSHDLMTWTAPFAHVFPRGKAPRWAVGDFWAPEIHVVGDSLVCYYTARHQQGQLAIGVATATSVEGPWTDRGEPLVLDPAVGWIDAHLLQDPSGLFLYYKGDHNGLRPRQPTPIVVRRLTADGLSFAGEPQTLLVNDRAWETTVVEGPWVVRRDGTYYMFYAAGQYDTAEYCTGVARSSTPTGPFEKYPEPVLGTHDSWSGPGHGCVVTAPDGSDWFVYHAWQGSKIVKHGSAERWPRMALAGRVHWPSARGEWPSIETFP
jgi:arabinan endo-1,5-alpha-L-arabinosidase